ncbi:MAG TPA: DUF3619 family protein [Pseudomonadales bacterium]|nr:DUF3619 family protein [Pseudomonadales bacterium]
MTDKQPDPATDSLAGVIKEALERSTSELDTDTLTQLREARMHALARKKTAWRIWRWPAMTAVAALAALILMPPLMHRSSIDPEQTSALVEMSLDEEIASVDDMEMLEDMEMIQALGEDTDNG